VAAVAPGFGPDGVVYTTRTPATDIHAVLEHVRRNAASLGVDARRIGLLAASATSWLPCQRYARHRPQCAALLYGFTLDLGGSTARASVTKYVSCVMSSDLCREQVKNDPCRPRTARRSSTGVFPDRLDRVAVDPPRSSVNP